MRGAKGDDLFFLSPLRRTNKPQMLFQQRNCGSTLLRYYRTVVKEEEEEKDTSYSTD